MPGTPANALDITQAGLVKFDGTSNFTGVTTTNHNVLLGAASNGITNLAPGTSGLPLVSQGAAADPTFAALGIAGGGTNATSFSNNQGVVVYDGSKLTNYAGPQISSSGLYTNTTQPAFSATLSNFVSNVTGDNTDYTVIFDTISSQQGSNYNNTTGTFTPPVTGWYLITTVIRFYNLTAAHNRGRLQVIQNVTGVITQLALNVGAIADSELNGCSLILSGIYPLVSGRGVTIVATVSGSTKTVGIDTGAQKSSFSCILLS